MRARFAILAALLAATALAHDGDGDSWEGARIAFESGSPGEVGAAALHSEKAFLGALTPSIEQRIFDKDPYAREAAAYLVKKYGGDEFLPTLMDALHDGTFEQKIDAAEVTGEAHLWKLAGSLRALATDPSQPAEVRAAAAKALGSTRSDRAAFGLAEALKDSTPAVRRAAVEGVEAAREMGYADDPAPLHAALGDPDAGVRRAAVRALARWGDATAAAPIAQLASDPDWHVRQDALWALVKLGAKDQRAAALALANDPHPRVRDAAAWAAAELK